MTVVASSAGLAESGHDQPTLKPKDDLTAKFRFDAPEVNPNALASWLQTSVFASHSSEAPACLSQKVATAFEKRGGSSCTPEIYATQLRAIEKAAATLKSMANQAALAVTRSPSPEQEACVSTVNAINSVPNQKSASAFDDASTRVKNGTLNLPGFKHELNSYSNGQASQIINSFSQLELLCKNKPVVPDNVPITPNDLLIYNYLANHNYKFEPELRSQICADHISLEVANQKLQDQALSLLFDTLKSGQSLTDALRNSVMTLTLSPFPATLNTARGQADHYLSKALQCPRSLSLSDSKCLCRTYTAKQKLEKLKQSATQGKHDQLEQIRNDARRDYIDAISNTRLSNALKQTLIQRAQTDFPRFEVEQELSINAAYVPPTGSSSEFFKIHASTLELPDTQIRSLFSHEIGHYFETSLYRPSAQNHLETADLAVLNSFRDCLDLSLAHGEFEVEPLEGVYVSSKENKDRIVSKRVELLADYFTRGLGKLKRDDRTEALTHFFCAKGPQVIADQLGINLEEFRKDLTGESTNSSDSTTGDLFARDSHSRHSWRRQVLLQGTGLDTNTTSRAHGRVEPTRLCENQLFQF